jgi:transcription elongation factor GreA
MSDVQYLTNEKMQEFKKELDFLKTEKRKQVAESLEYAKSLGDLSENAEYHEARAGQAELEDRISKLENILKTAVIVSEKHGEKTEIGSKITIEKEGTGEKIGYTIVGSEETDLSTGKISSSSPLGSALLGKKKGEKIVLKTPKGNVKYSIIKVE